MAGGIFISYRREDTAGFAGRIYDRLKTHFDPEYLFLDVDNIDPGLDFFEILSERVGDCDALIAIIGRSWADCRDESGGRRLDNANDFVRIEIEAALERNVRVIPVLVDGTPMPKAEQLPASLERFARRTNVEISHRYFDDGISRLLRTLAFVEDKIRQRAEQEAQRLADEEARQKAETEARRLADEEARRQAEAEARLKEEKEASRRAEEEARRKEEAEWRQKAVEEARQRMEMETRLKAAERAEKEAKQRRAEQEAEQAAATARQAEIAQRRRAEAEAEALRKAEEEARRPAKAEAEAQKSGQGFVSKILIGIVGAIVGSFIATTLGLRSGYGVLWSIPVAAGGAVIALVAHSALSKRKQRQAAALNMGGAGSEALSTGRPAPPKPPNKLRRVGLISLLLFVGGAWVLGSRDPVTPADQFMLGWRYETGNGVVQDYEQAAIWYRKAADQGDDDAQYSLGGLYENGNGVARNLATARAWYAKAASQGNSDAKAALARLGKK